MAIATIFQPRDELWRRKVISPVDDEAACAALTKGAANNKEALMLVFTTRSLAAQYDEATWAERVPSKANPADLPSRNKELAFKTEPIYRSFRNKELLSVEAPFPSRDLPFPSLHHAD